MTNIAELDRVMTFIKDNPEKHNQSVWSNDCGTAACLAGWACLLNGATVDKSRFYGGFSYVGGPIIDSGGRKNIIKNAAIDILELDGWDADVLFEASNTVADLELMVKDLSNGDSLRDHWKYNAETDRQERIEDTEPDS